MLDLKKSKKFFSIFKIEKFPTLSQWQRFFGILNKNEKIKFFSLLFLFVASFLTLSLTVYFKNTQVVPKEGGTYTEGIIGSPRFINPVYSAVYDVDRDLTELIYSGLMKYDKDGKIIADLVKEYTISDDGRIYEFYLKDGLSWSDGKPLTADDVVFTVKTIQNSTLKSPVRSIWLGVKVEKLSDSGIRFELKNPSSVFLENCVLKIMPEHIWKDITAQNFPLSVYNLKPIGSGRYKIKDVIQDSEGNMKSLELVINQHYDGSRPYISKLIFYFFENENDLIKAFNSKKIQGMSLLSLNKLKDLKSKYFNIYHLSLPRYFSVFFNFDTPQNLSDLLVDKNIRLALNYATNKKEIVEKVLLNNGKTVDSPILPDVYGFNDPSKVYEYDIDKAVKLLEKSGFKKNENGIFEKIIKKEPSFQFKSDLKLGSQGTEVRELQKCLANPNVGGPDIYPSGEISGYFGSKTKEAVIKFQEKYTEEILAPSNLTKGTGDVKKATRDKLNKICAAQAEKTTHVSFTLTTVDQPILNEVALLLKEQWALAGINIDIKTYDISALEQDIIKPRNYEMLLFGEILGATPDLFPFWHSSQKADPGLNLSQYEDKKSDALLEEVRQTIEATEQKSIALEKFQNLLIETAPAVFLYNPDYLYLANKHVKGINEKIIVDPSKRFSDVEEWYFKTKRAWK